MLGGDTEGYAVVEVGLGVVVMSMECMRASRRYVYVHKDARTRQDRFSHVGRAVVERWHGPRHLEAVCGVLASLANSTVTIRDIGTFSSICIQPVMM